MNNYNINDENFINSNLYKEFIKDNPGLGYLRIRAYAASGAVPISGMNINISTDYNNNKITLFEGSTNASGIIDSIALPAPKQSNNDLTVPNFITYDLTATYGNNISRFYKINIFDNLIVVQNISITSEMSEF